MNTVPLVRTLGELLLLANHLPYNGPVYLQGEHPWTSSSIAAVSGRNLEVEYPEFVKAHGLTRSLNIDQVQDIVLNAQLQKPDVEVQELVRAFHHYWKYDGFLEL